MGPILRGVDGSFQVVWPTYLGSGFGTNAKLLRGVIGPISSPNDERNTAFVDVVSLEKSLKKQKITNQN